MTSETGETGLDSLLSVAAGFMAARTLLAAVELGVFTVLGDGARSGARIAAEAGLHARATPDFLDALVALKLLVRDGDAYRNSADADLYLDRGKPTYAGGVLERMGGHDYPMWGSLTGALRSGEPQVATPVASSPASSPAGAGRDYQDGRAWALAPVVEELIARVDWSGVETVVEVGGAGLLTVRLAQAYPGISGGVVHATPEYAENVERLFLTDQLVTYDDLPPADVYVLSEVLARLDPAARDAMLARAHASLPPGGMLVVQDRMVDDGRRRNTAALLSSLGLLLETPAGRQSTTAEAGAWLAAAGFRDVATEELGHGWSAVVGRR
ncbi:methyltransferase dimerization domain-containing protein [Actinoplanes sp. NPDC089786]|uniref:methyltransferase n=1 Tax=Actinoplanes sp. NPDC089786 TaxID=3155185 RepID=UPI003428EDA3